ncbi:uncharacterized protein LOC18427099 isoform X3 [Amborella trichopoda]|uniref:uncharacterized protein LOC18427099 isoform X3 n=1 Tax=Amborella trichopoda TaxID=13333 RepID=UPI0009C05B7B|nr:uncharacterized protein LOC18427099 isoform X3 [Amborella trichopoda]|eukprot:XP_020518453.1 uncharacterized protein LOC18427099 isoform X3 [Amborella trichopoda]
MASALCIPPSFARPTETPLRCYSHGISAKFRQFSLSSRHETLVEIQNSGVIACLRAQSGQLAMEAACAALRGGISMLEVVVSTPGVFEVITALTKDHPSSIIGAGTILNAKDATCAINAGAKFLMSPATIKVLSAYNANAEIVKVYPVTSLGGPHYISAIKKPFSNIPMVASQGITIDTMESYIHAGASAVVLSDAIFEKEAMRRQDFDAISQLASLAASRGRAALHRLYIPII